MKCPYCNQDNTRVVDSRPVDENSAIRRRRMCDECGRRFTTYEKVETIPLIIIKKDQNREQYDRSKLEGGIIRACPQTAGAHAGGSIIWWTGWRQRSSTGRKKRCPAP